jgi:myo-inositol-1(or 4)-monophosphatase
VTEDVLSGRKYVVIRAIGDTPVSMRVTREIPNNFYSLFVQTEKGADAQKRIVREFYDTVSDIEPN